MFAFYKYLFSKQPNFKQNDLINYLDKVDLLKNFIT